MDRTPGALLNWYRVLAPCPRCSRLPALHLPEWLVEHARSVEAELPVLDYQCQRHTCRGPRGKRTTYIIAAHAISRAELVVPKEDAA